MIYVEVFGGGGSVLLNKERSVREVLNDANGNLINLYRVVREHPDELKDRLLYVMHNREDFKIAQRRLEEATGRCFPVLPQQDGNSSDSQGKLAEKKPEVSSPVLRAADFYQVVRQSYAGNGKQFSAVARSMWAGFPAIDRVAGRLQGVTLEKEDFGVIFQRYDSPNTHFYIDPPYFFTEDYYPGNIFLRSDHQRLAAILLNAEGLWLLSYNLCPEVLELLGLIHQCASEKYKACAPGGSDHITIHLKRLLEQHPAREDLLERALRKIILQPECDVRLQLVNGKVF